MAMTRRSGASTPSWVVFAYVLGLVLVFVGERVVSGVDWLRLLLTGLGVLLVVGLTVVRWLVARSAAAERRTVERALALLATGGALALALYFATIDPVERVLHVSSWEVGARHRYESALTVLWIVLVLATILPMLFAERALFPMRRSENVEWRRVREALVAGTSLALAAVYGSLFCFVAGELDWKADFSYFHTARPSESTRNIARSSTEPLEVQAFFPQLNPVGTEVASYLRDLARGEPNIHVQSYDRLLVPDVARKSQVFEDGVIVVVRGTEHEALTVGTDLNGARRTLRTLDNDFQKTLLKVLRSRRTAYLTVGHGEMNDSQPTPQNEGRTSHGLRELLERQNYLVRDLGATTGLATDVPADAGLVLILGPAQPFLPEELASLQRFLKRGGRIFVCLDPEPHVALQPLADLVDVKWDPAILANEHVHLRRRFNESDNAVLVTNRFSSHASVSTLSRISSRPVVFAGAGSIQPKPGLDHAIHVDLTIRSMPDTFADENGNFAFDPSERRAAYGLAAAVTAPAGDAPKKNDEMRGFVLADVDVVSDAALGNEANVLLAADALRWLGGEESFAGAMSTAEDVKILHTKQKDLVWFYGSIFAIPALVLGAGLLYSRRVRRSRRGARRSGALPGEVTA